jgi:hypothetical protein
MAEMCVTVDDATLRRAPHRARVRGTTVDALVQDYLIAFAAQSNQRAAMIAVVRLAESTSSSSGPGGRTWTRGQLHE